MPCSVENGSRLGTQSIEITNGLLRVVVLPELGGRIWELDDSRRHRQWIWHHPSTTPGRLPLGADYDSNWAGGWEELFPNDGISSFNGVDLPDHGEWWNLPWSAHFEVNTPARVVVTLSRRGAVTPTVWHKTIEVLDGVPSVNVHYEIENTSDATLHVLFKQHLPVPIDQDLAIELPGGVVIPVDLSFSGRIGREGPFKWPNAADRNGDAVDLSTSPPESERTQEFVYVRDLPEAWCGVHDKSTGARLRMTFDSTVFPFVWLFMSFGGWQGIRTVVLEPCTNMPKDLAAARQAGQCAQIGAHGRLTTSVSVQLS